VCQGEKTEPNYFRSFRVADVKILHANGDPMQVVEYAEKAYVKNTEYDAVWCVFDFDSFPQFDAAIKRAENLAAQKKPFHVAWSNECFELWYLLHFEYLQSSLNRSAYIGKLTQHLETPYVKNDQLMRDRLKAKEAVAEENVKKLKRLHSESGVTLPSKCCPMTTVGELVAVLRNARG